MAEVASSSTVMNNSAAPLQSNDIPSWQKTAMDAPPKSNLIVNYLPSTYNETDLYELFNPFGMILHYKIVKNLETSRSMGYGFVQFADPDSASKAVESLNGALIQNKQLKVSIARPASSEIKRSNLYIIGLPLNWTKQDLINLFSSYGDVVESRILLDNTTHQSRGVGFCRLGSNAAALHAIDALNGTIPNGGTTKLTIKIADNPNHMRRHAQHPMAGHHQGHPALQNPNQMSPQSQQAHGLLMGNYAQQQFKPMDYRHYPQFPQPQHHAFAYQQPGPGPLVPQHAFGTTQQHHYPVVKSGAIQNNMGNGMSNMASMNGLNAGMNNGLSNMNSVIMGGHGNPIASSSPVMGSHPMHSNVVNPQAGPSGNQFQGICLFVYHLPLDVTDQALYELFSQYATVTSTKVMKDISNGQSRGYGFVNVLTEQDGHNAIQNLNSHKLGSKFIKVSFKSNKPQ